MLLQDHVDFSSNNSWLPYSTHGLTSSFFCSRPHLPHCTDEETNIERGAAGKYKVRSQMPQGHFKMLISPDRMASVKCTCASLCRVNATDPVTISFEVQLGGEQ